MNTMAAANGETVTQAHADHCAENGHAVWTVDGRDSGTCPRCGEVKTTECYACTWDLRSHQHTC